MTSLRRVSMAALVVGMWLFAGCSEKQEAARPEAERSAPSATAGKQAGETPKETEAESTEAPADEGLVLQAAPGAEESAEAESEPTAEGAAVIVVAGIDFDVPEGWTKETPTSSMRAAQYSLPGDAGAAELVVYHFGPHQGGPAQANIDRWVGQLKNPDDPHTPAEHETDRFEQNGLTISTVQVKGTYAPPAMGPMAPAAPPQEGYALHGIVVEGGPQGSVFVKVTGPEATVTAQTPAIESFTRSARVAQ